MTRLGPEDPAQPARRPSRGLPKASRGNSAGPMHSETCAGRSRRWHPTGTSVADETFKGDAKDVRAIEQGPTFCEVLRAFDRGDEALEQHAVGFGMLR